MLSYTFDSGDAQIGADFTGNEWHNHAFRPHYIVTVFLPNGEEYSTDAFGGTNSVPDEEEAIRSELAFILAAVESDRYGNDVYDSSFDDAVIEWADENSDDLELLLSELGG